MLCHFCSAITPASLYDGRSQYRRLYSVYENMIDRCDLCILLAEAVLSQSNHLSSESFWRSVEQNTPVQVLAKWQTSNPLLGSLQLKTSSKNNNLRKLDICVIQGKLL
jgi:hypothetical protein